MYNVHIFNPYISYLTLFSSKDLWFVVYIHFEMKLILGYTAMYKTSDIFKWWEKMSQKTVSH